MAPPTMAPVWALWVTVGANIVFGSTVVFVEGAGDDITGVSSESEALVAADVPLELDGSVL